MKIHRERWVIMLNNRTEIFCGGNRNFHFKAVDEIGNTPVKTYVSKACAMNAAAWACAISANDDIEVVKVIESIESVD